jgi:hypothetical protein
MGRDLEKSVMILPRHYSGIFLDGMRKTKTTTFTVADVLVKIPTENPSPLEYDSRALPLL